jgi:tape measure domain-containing protein
MADNLALRLKIGGDTAEAVKALIDLQAKIAALTPSLAAAQAESARLKTTFDQAEQKTGSLAIQFALAKKALSDMADQGVSKTGVQYQALAGEIANMDAELKRSIGASNAAEKAYNAQARATKTLQDNLDRTTTSATAQEKALASAGVKTGQLQQEYARLNREIANTKAQQQFAERLTASASAQNAAIAKSKEQEAALRRLAEAGAAVNAQLERTRAAQAATKEAEAAAKLKAQADAAKLLAERLDAAGAAGLAAAERQRSALEMTRRLTASAQSQQEKFNAAMQALNFSPAQQRTQTEIRRLQSAFDTLRTSGQLSATQIAEAQGRLRARIAELNGETQNAGGLFGRLQGVAKGAGAAVAGAFAISRIKQFGEELVTVAAKYDRINAVLKLTQGGSKQAGDAMEFVRGTAEKLGLDLGTTATSFAKLSAATKGSALEGEQTRRIFASVAGAMSKLGNTSAETEGAFLALGQMISKGKVQAEELRGQLGERLPGAFQLAANAMGVTAEKLEKMMENGEVLAADLLPALANELDKTFGTGQVDTLQGNINRLGTAWEEFKAGLADTLGVKDAVSGLTDLLRLDADIGLATSEAFGKTADELEKMRAATERMMALRKDEADIIAEEHYRQKLVEIGQEMEKLIKIQGQPVSAANLNMGPMIDPKNTEMLAAAMDRARAAVKELDAAQRQGDATQGEVNAAVAAATAATGAYEKALTAATKESTAAAKSEADRTAAMQSNFAILTELATAQRDAARVSGDTATALQKEGELRRLAVAEADALAAAKHREAEASKAHYQAVALENQEAAKNSEAARALIADAEKEITAKVGAARAAEAHAAALGKLPDTLAKVTREQALSNEQISAYGEVAQAAINHVRELEEAQRNGAATESEVATARTEAAGTLATYNQALQTHAQQMQAAESAKSRETSLIGQSYQARIAEAQALQAAAKARGENSAAAQYGADLARLEVDQARAVAESKVGEAQAAVAVAQALREQAAADGTLSDAERQAIAQANDAAKAKQMEASAAIAAATAKAAETQATRQSTAASEEQVSVVQNISIAFAGVGEAVSRLYDPLEASIGQIRELSGYVADQVQQTYKASGSWDEYFASIRQGMFEFDRLQTVKGDVDELTASVRRATETGEGLAHAARQTTVGFGELDKQHLDGLQAAIDAAKQKVEALRQSAASTLSTLQNELDQLNGNDAAILSREEAEKRLDIEKQLDAARAAGDAESVAALQKSLDLLGDIYSTKTANLRAEQAQNAAASEGLAIQKNQTAGAKEYGEALKTAGKKAADATKTALETIGKGTAEAIGNAAAAASAAISDYQTKLDAINASARDFAGGIDDQIRDIRNAGLSGEEQRLDRIRQLREKIAAIQEAIGANDLEYAQQLRDQVTQIAGGLANAVTDAQGNILVSQQQAGEEAIAFLRQAKNLNEQIKVAQEAQASAERNEKLQAIAEERDAKIAALKVEFGTRNAEIEKSKQAEIAAAEEVHKKRMADIRAERTAREQGVGAPIGGSRAGIAQTKSGSHTDTPGLTFIPGYASGGTPDEGWAMVGEKGRELVHFSGRERVYSADQTAAALRLAIGRMATPLTPMAIRGASSPAQRPTSMSDGGPEMTINLTLNGKSATGRFPRTSGTAALLSDLKRAGAAS